MTDNPYKNNKSNKRTASEIERPPVDGAKKHTDAVEIPPHIIAHMKNYCVLTKYSTDLKEKRKDTEEQIAKIQTELDKYMEVVPVDKVSYDDMVIGSTMKETKKVPKLSIADVVQFLSEKHPSVHVELEKLATAKAANYKPEKKRKTTVSQLVNVPQLKVLR